MTTHHTPVYGLAYADTDTALGDLAAITQAVAETIEAALEQLATLETSGVGAGGMTEASLAASLVTAFSPLAAAIADMGRSITLRSPTDRMADTTRLRVISNQVQQASNNQNGGEGLWLDLGDVRAKNMLTWRLPVNRSTRAPLAVGAPVTDADMQRITWAGAHYYAQDQPDQNNPTDIHGHWSVEVPDSGLALRTRLEVRFVDEAHNVGTDKTLIQTASADLVVDCSNGQVLRLRTAAGSEKAIEWADDEYGHQPRWRLKVRPFPESGANAGADLSFQRFSDAGAVQDEPMILTRSNGRVTVGGENGTAAGLTVNRASAGAAVTINTNMAGAAGATGIAHTGLDASSRVLDIKVTTDGTSRFVLWTSGLLEWGTGAAARDVNLNRPAAGTLATNAAFRVMAVGTASRPSASVVGAGAHIYDSTLKKPVWSDGTTWRDAMGTAV